MPLTRFFALARRGLGRLYEQQFDASVAFALYSVEHAYARHKDYKSRAAAAYKRQGQARGRYAARYDRDIHQIGRASCRDRVCTDV